MQPVRTDSFQTNFNFEYLPRCGPRRLSRNGHFAMLNFSVYLAMAIGLLLVVALI